MGLRTSAISKVSVSGRKGKKDLAATHRDGEDIEREYRENAEEEDEPTETTATRYLSTSGIRTDGGTQSRDGLSEATIKEYTEKFLDGAQFPALVVFYDGAEYWLADGFHRIAAAQDAQIDLIECYVMQGTQRDAILFSVGANGRHGLPRTNDDKRRAVQTLLSDPEWSRWSNREIAKRCEVSPGLVDKMRNAELEKAQTSSLPTEGSQRTYTNRHGQEAKMDVSNIGKQVEFKVGMTVRNIHSNQVGTITHVNMLNVLVETVNGEKSYDKSHLEVISETPPVEFKVGMYVKQIQSGQTGPIISINGARISVQTANGARIYDRSKLEVIDTPDIPQAYTAMQADRIKTHWGSSSGGKYFQSRLQNYDFGEEVYDLLQPGAKTITDLNMTQREAESAVSKLVKARTLERFPIDSIVKSGRGDFGRVTGATEYALEVIDLRTERKTSFNITSASLSTMEAYEKAPKPHWADQYGDDFEKSVAKLGLQMSEVLERLQHGAKSIRDLKKDYWDARAGVATIIQERYAEQFPVDSIIKTPSGHFGKISRIYSTGVSIRNFVTGDFDRLDFEALTLSSQEELDAVLAACPPSGFDRFDDYTAEKILAVMPALRRVLDFAQGLSTWPMIGGDLDQLGEFLSEVGDLIAESIDDEDETDEGDEE